MTRAEIRKQVYAQFPIPKEMRCQEKIKKIEIARNEAIEKLVKMQAPSKKEYK